MCCVVAFGDADGPPIGTKSVRTTSNFGPIRMNGSRSVVSGSWNVESKLELPFAGIPNQLRTSKLVDGRNRGRKFVTSSFGV